MPLITDPSDPTESALEVRASGGQSVAILKVTDEHGVELGTFDKHGVVFSYPVWQDEVSPATNLRAGPGGVDTDYGALIFRAGQTDASVAGFQLKHGIKAGTFKPHVHWWKPTSAAGTVKWQARFSFANAGAVLNDITAESWADGTVIVSDGNTARQTAITTWSLDLSTAKDSCLVVMQIQRVSSGGTADTYAADARLQSVDLHYQWRAYGSYGEYSGA